MWQQYYYGVYVVVYFSICSFVFSYVYQFAHHFTVHFQWNHQHKTDVVPSTLRHFNNATYIHCLTARCLTDYDLTDLQLDLSKQSKYSVILKFNRIINVIFVIENDVECDTTDNFSFKSHNSNWTGENKLNTWLLISDYWKFTFNRY